MTNFLSKEVAKRLVQRAGQSENLKLDNLIEVRTEFKKIEKDLRAEHAVMDFYAEAAPLVRMSSKTLQDNLGIIREYTASILHLWITESGLGFDHIATANRYSEIEGTKFYGNPAGLLDAAIKYGSKTGNRPMTVDEMIAFTTGEKNVVMFSFLAVVQRAIGKLISEMPNSWDKAKRQAFEARAQDFKDGLQRDFFDVQ